MGKSERDGDGDGDGAMPRVVGSPRQELDVARVETRPPRKRHASWKQLLAEAATQCETLLPGRTRRERTVAHDELRPRMYPTG